jgi:hypothetical protein
MVSRDSGGLERESNRVMAGTTPGHDGLGYLKVFTGRKIA